MSKLESIKAELSLHEKILFAAVAIMITLVGWTAANYLVVKGWLLFMGISNNPTNFPAVLGYPRIATK